MIDPDWLAELQRRTVAPPVPPRRPLTLAFHDRRPDARIGSIEAGPAQVLAGAGLPMRDTGAAWRIEPSTAASPDALFATIAETLRAHRLAAAWRDERLAVTDQDGAVVGAIERAAVRPLGIATHAVHLIAHRPDGRVWVQQRAADKSTDPGLWDTTMGGLIAAGESLQAGLERETWEEAGLRPAELHALQRFDRFTVRRPVAHGYMVEATELFEASVGDDAVPVNQDGEVDRFEAIDRAELLDRLRADAFTLEAALALALWLRHRDAGLEAR